VAWPELGVKIVCGFAVDMYDSWKHHQMNGWYVALQENEGITEVVVDFNKDSLGQLLPAHRG
jgi:hypothetical protein